MKTKKVTLTAQIYLSFDENEQEFKNSIESYRDATESVDDDETLKADMLQYIALVVTIFGVEKEIEGIGYLSVDGKKQDKKLKWCGVDVDSSCFTIMGTPDFQTEIE